VVEDAGFNPEEHTFFALNCIADIKLRCVTHFKGLFIIELIEA
jgi:hypothetical protein